MRMANGLLQANRTYRVPRQVLRLEPSGRLEEIAIPTQVLRRWRPGNHFFQLSDVSGIDLASEQYGRCQNTLCANSGVSCRVKALRATVSEVMIVWWWALFGQRKKLRL